LDRHYPAKLQEKLEVSPIILVTVRRELISDKSRDSSTDYCVFLERLPGSIIQQRSLRFAVSPRCGNSGAFVQGGTNWLPGTRTLMATQQSMQAVPAVAERIPVGGIPNFLVGLGSRRLATPAFALGIAAVVIWSFWTTLLDIGERWAHDPQYSHGFLVPLFSVYLLWRSRGKMREVELRSRWWGVGVVAVGIAMRLAGLFFYQPWLDSGSLLVVLAGLAAATGGRKALIWAGPAILFLAFMLPLPYRFQTMLGGTLQRVATIASTYALQTLGVPAVSEGNVVLLSETRLGIVEACSGLSMLVTFFALAAAVAILATRNWIEAIVVFCSAIPIAVVANVARITVTGALYEANQNELARVIFHDVAGWLMMPLGLGLLLVELHILGRAVVPVDGPTKSA
jgi:exosortase